MIKHSDQSKFKRELQPDTNISYFTETTHETLIYYKNVVLFEFVKMYLNIKHFTKFVKWVPCSVNFIYRILFIQWLLFCVT